MIKKLKDFFTRKVNKLPDGFTFRDTKDQVNPLCNIVVEYQGREIFNQPFLFIMDVYLKDYGFDPESKRDGSLLVKFHWPGGMDFGFPLYVKKKDGHVFGKRFTLDEAVKLGYFVPPRRAAAR